MPTYTQLASTYATLNAYTSSGKKIWEIEERTGPGIPASVLALDGNDPIATMILSRDPVFYDPMIDESNSNRLVSKDFGVAQNGRISNKGYLAMQYNSEYLVSKGDLINFSGSTLIPAGTYVVQDIAYYLNYYRAIVIDSVGADGGPNTDTCTFSFKSSQIAGFKEGSGTRQNRTAVNSTRVRQGDCSLRVENRTDINAIDYPNTIEMMFRGGDDFGFFNSITGKTLFEFFRPYSKFVLFNTPVQVPIESFSVTSNYRTITTLGNHNIPAGNTSGVSPSTYGSVYTPTVGSRAAGATTITIGSHSFVAGNPIMVSNPLSGYSTTGGYEVITSVGATTITYGAMANHLGGYYSQAGTTTLVVDTFSAHGLTAGMSVYHADAINAWANGNFTVVSTPSSQQYTVTVSTSATYSGDFGYMAKNVTGEAMTGTVQGYISGSIWAPTITGPRTIQVYDFYLPNMSTTTATSGYVWGNGLGAQSRVTAESSFFSTIYYSITGGVNINDGNWHHIAVTHEDSAIYEDDPNLAGSGVVATLYVDGVFQGRDGGAWSGMPTEFSYPGVAGAYDWSSTGSGGVTTEVAHLAIHNRVLNPYEIASHAALRNLPPSWQGGYLVFDGSEWRQTLL